MNCQTCRIEIEEMETGERLSERASEHITSCPPCRAFHDERQALRRLVGSLEPVNAPPDFEFRLRARLAATGNGGSPHFSWRTFISSAPAIGLAATFALLVAGVVFYYQIKSGPETVNRVDEVSRQQTTPNSEPANTSSGTMTPTQAPAVSMPDKKESSSPVILNAGVHNQPSRSTVSTKGIHHQPRRFETGGAQIINNDIASRPAPQIRPVGDLPLTASANQLVELPVRSSSQPVRVFVNDQKGGRRTVFLEPVVFGSQDLTVGGGSRAASPQGIW